MDYNIPWMHCAVGGIKIVKYSLFMEALLFKVHPSVLQGKCVFRHHRQVAIGLLLAIAMVLSTISNGVAGEVLGPKALQIVGSVKTTSGDALLGRDGKRISADVGDHLHQGDVLYTSSDSTMGVIFRDDTILSLGPDSEVSIDEFIFEPAEDSLSFLTSVGKGTAQYISGQIAKIQPDAMLVDTPQSTIGIRGTRFLVKVD